MDIKNCIYEYSEEKNKILQESRNISFEEIIFAIENNWILDVIENPSKNHKNQFCYVIEISDYIYLVPFVKTKNNNYFLKTIYPSRKYKKIYK